MDKTAYTFALLTYNQEEFIVECLESIKYQIINYGEGIECHLVISDDCSPDNTVETINSWLESNRELFAYTNVIAGETNIGTVRNMFRLLDNIKTPLYKVLAGDDKFYTNNIFELNEYISEPNTLVFTPVLPFGDYSDCQPVFADWFKMISYCNTPKKLKKLINITNFIHTPGVFQTQGIFEEEGLRTYSMQFFYLEDYARWLYILNDKNTDYKLKFVTKPYICYRVASGISTNKNHPKYKKLQAEYDLLKKIYDTKYNKLPSLINPWRYYLVWLRFIRNITNRKVCQEIDAVYNAYFEEDKKSKA